MDLEERTDGLYVSGRKLDAYKIPDSTVMQVDLRLKGGDCPEGRIGDLIRVCPGDCQNTYLMFMFSGDDLVRVGELADVGTVYTKMDVASKYGARELVDVADILRKRPVEHRRMQNDRGFEVYIHKELLLMKFEKCVFHYVAEGLEARYPLEFACITSNLDKIRDYAIEGWPPEIKVVHGRMN